LVEVFLNKNAIPMEVTGFPTDDEALENQKELFKLMKNHYEGKSSLSIKLEKESD
jgi:hypothetical protein